LEQALSYLPAKSRSTASASVVFGLVRLAFGA
jgi:hypothetical protein